MFLEVSELEKAYGTEETTSQVLKGVNFGIEEGKICVILGPSGSGKSTLLNIIGAIDSADSGKVVIDGKDITKYNRKQLSEYRRDYLGFVFQFYNLIPNLNVEENIRVCDYLSQNPLNIDDLLNTLGLAEHRYKFPSQLSGGQQQRCAMARALIKRPKLLLCDEPTGALDYKTSKEMLGLIETINRKYAMTIVIVTHNEVIQRMAHYTIKIKDGKVANFSENPTPATANSLEW
ncbi:MAG: ABC transporter ATP-binding protein [Ruminococcus sp.]|nr:ABC transporter ATP-binding protein [Ruminococcus sp.]